MMIAVSNRVTYPAPLLWFQPLLLAGMCLLTWGLWTCGGSQTHTAAEEGMRILFSLIGPIMACTVLAVMLDSWLGTQTYAAVNGWLHAEKNLFGLHWAGFDYDLELVESCSVCRIDEQTPLDGDLPERLRHAGAVICRKGKTAPEQVKPCWACRLCYDGQTLILLATADRQPVERLARFIEAARQQYREKLA